MNHKPETKNKEPHGDASHNINEAVHAQIYPPYGNERNQRENQRESNQNWEIIHFMTICFQHIVQQVSRKANSVESMRWRQSVLHCIIFLIFCSRYSSNRRWAGSWGWYSILNRIPSIITESYEKSHLPPQSAMPAPEKKRKKSSIEWDGNQTT